MKFEPTNAQRLAINTDRNSLVSAAAGSGKTAVLVNRVVNKLCDENNPLWANELLIVTFTNAAAAELKLRIEKKLNEKICENPNSAHLQKQKMLLSGAAISTIDSFCINFIRDNFEKADVEPSFKIADSIDSRMLLSASVSRLFNDEFNSGNQEFLALLDYIGSDYDDADLTGLVCNIYGYALKMPYPEKWIENTVKSYTDFVSGANEQWFCEGLGIFADYAEEAMELIESAEDALSSNDVAAQNYGGSISYVKEFARSLLKHIENEDWDSVCGMINAFSPPSLKAVRGNDKDEFSEYARAQHTASVATLKKGFELIYAPKSFIKQETADALPHIKKLSELVIKLGEIYNEELRSRGLMTFDMIEQTALSLISEYKDGRIVKSRNADELISRYKEVLVDEYQDTNNLQDTLFNLLSDNQRHLFCVGDAKQSIYRFRGANPANFIEKKTLYKSSGEALGLRIDLSGNFRSRKGICEYANRLFGFVMHKEYADIEYDEFEKLEALASFPESSHIEVEKHFIDLKAVKASGTLRAETNEKAEAEAHIIAKKILDCIAAEPFIKETRKTVNTDGTEDEELYLRKARFGDMVILMQSTDNADIISSVLKKYGIPVTAQAKGILGTDEVAVLVALLRVIDNPFDDIALLTVMTSRLFGFTIDDLASIRAYAKKGKMISAVTVAAEENKKARDFNDMLRKFREKNVVFSVAGLIDSIFEYTNFIGIASRMPDGSVKKASLMALRNFAAGFEADGKRSLGEFLRVFDRMIDKDFDIKLVGSEEAVRIMTVHSSKGLQFPVCILAECEHQFNFKDCYKPLLLSEKYGFSFKYFDEQKNDKSKTLLRVLMQEYEKSQILAEQVRLLYVAVTRAENKLIITSCVGDLKSKIKKYQDMKFFKDKSLKKKYFKSSNCFSDWIFADEFLNNADKFIDYSEHDITDEYIHIQIENPEEVSEEIFVADAETVIKLRGNYSCPYKFKAALGIESKFSVTEIVHKSDISKYEFKGRPSFMNEGGMTAAEKGTSTHKFMQFCDFSSAVLSVKKEAERLCEYGFLTESERDAVNIRSVERFFTSSLFEDIAAADEVRREKNFLCEFPASLFGPKQADLPQDEKVIVQGAIDLLFIKNGEATVVDFKTDRNKTAEQLREDYSEQLRLYGLAVNKLYKLPVTRLVIYSFDCGEEVEC